MVTKEILPPDKPIEAITASEWLENEDGVRARCERYALAIKKIARIRLDGMRRSMDIWSDSLDEIPRDAKIRAENEALIKYDLSPRFDIAKEAE